MHAGNAIKFSASGRVSVVAGILTPQSGPRPSTAQLLYPQPIEASDGSIDAGNEWTFSRAAVDAMPVFVATSEQQRHHRNQTVTTVAQHGREAVDYVAAYLQAVDRAAAAGEPPRERLDAILMDLHMPVMDGFEAARTIRALEAQRQHAHTGAAMPIPIITISADDPDAMGALCRAAGMQAYLRKPIVLGDLRMALSHWISLPPIDA